MQGSRFAAQRAGHQAAATLIKVAPPMAIQASAGSAETGTPAHCDPIVVAIRVPVK